MKITLVQCPFWSIISPPYAIACLSAYLRSKGHEVFVFDLNVELYHHVKQNDKRYWDLLQDIFFTDESLIAKFVSENDELLESYVEQILKTKARIIGFSIYDCSELMSLVIARRIKDKDPSKIIVFGGPQCSSNIAGMKIIREEAVDIIVQSEGEETLLEIVETIEKEGKIAFCQGILLKNKEKVINCGERPLIKSLGTLPFPDFTDFSFNLYQDPQRIPLSSSRGCINRCVFCNERPFWRRYRFRSGESMFEEIKYQLRQRTQGEKTKNGFFQKTIQFVYLNKMTFIRKIAHFVLSVLPFKEKIRSRKERSIYFFHFNDSLLNGNIRTLSRLCDLIIADDLVIRWAGQASIRSEMGLDLLKKFKRSGCALLDYGIESGSQKIIDKMRKEFLIKDAEQVIRDTHQAGIDVVVNFMFGFPGETEEEFKETLDFVSRNKKYISIVNPSPSFAGFAPGTYGYDHPEEFGIKLGKDWIYWESLDGKNKYPERLIRFESFYNFISSVGINSITNISHSKWQMLGHYYYQHRNYEKAIECYERFLSLVPESGVILQRLEHCREEYLKSKKSGEGHQ